MVDRRDVNHDVTRFLQPSATTAPHLSSSEKQTGNAFEEAEDKPPTTLGEFKEWAERRSDLVRLSCTLHYDVF